MSDKIFKNPYIVAVFAFVILYVLFYLFGIGSTTQIIDGKSKKTRSWKYPLALSLLIWLLWKFVLFPASEVIVNIPIIPLTGGKSSLNEMNSMNMDYLWN